MATLADLPPELRAYIANADQEGDIPSETVLAAIGVSISKLRDEAKEARVTSGIEDRWREAEEAYAGIDDVNRGEVNGGAQWTKGMSPNSPISSDDVPDTGNLSTLYPMMTQRYVNMGAAKIGEILLAPGAKSFSFSTTPLPELINAKDDKRQVTLDHLPGNPPAMVQAQPGEGEVAMPSSISAPGVSPPPAAPVPAPAGSLPQAPAGAAGPVAGPLGALAGAAPPAGAPAGPPVAPLTVADLAKEKMEQADEAAKKAEKRIYDWHVECGRTAQVRKVIFDAARLGVGVLKGPFPQKSRQIATRKSADGIVMGIREVDSARLQMGQCVEFLS